MKTFEKRPDRIEAIQVTEENRDELLTFAQVRPVQDGAYVVESDQGSFIVRDCEWLCRTPGSSHFFVMSAFSLRNHYLEV